MNRTITLALASILAASAFAGDEFKLSGWIDTYYQHDFNKSANGVNLTGRQFDPRAGSFELGSAQLNLKWKKSDTFSLTADLALGRTPGISSAYDAANGNSNQIFQQLYASFGQSNGGTLDFGKFNTWIGYESPYVVDNANYSLATLTNFAQPTWHVGVRYSKPFSDTSSFSLYLVNGWNETQDTNSSKTYGATYATAVGDDKNLTLNYIGGEEGQNGIGFPNAGTSTVHLFDAVATWKRSDSQTFALNADYGTSSGANSGTWSGYSLYLNNKLSDERDFNIRWSSLQDRAGIRGHGGSISSLTGTYKIKTSEDTSLLFELRKDFSNTAFFQSDAGAKKERTTLTVAHAVRF